MLQSMSNYLDGRAEGSMNDLSLVATLNALAEPRRLQLLELIVQGVQCNCDLGEALGMAPNLVSHHLSVLRETGLVQAERDLLDARWVYYSVDPTALRQLGDALGSLLNPDRIQPRRATCGPRCPPARERGSHRYVSNKTKEALRT